MTRNPGWDWNPSLTSRYLLANDNNALLFISVHHNSSNFPWKNGTSVVYPSNHDINESTAVASTINTWVWSYTPFTWIDPYQDYRGLAILRGTKMPAVITETGHMSNDGDMSYIRDVWNSDNIAQCITSGIGDYYGSY